MGGGMGRQLIEYALADGQSIVVEAEGDAGPVQRGRGDAPVERAAESFEAAVAKLKPAAAAVIDGLKGLTPEEITLELGLKFSAKAGVVLASADSEATFKVTLKWKPKV
jgi:hypothetical protein